MTQEREIADGLVGEGEGPADGIPAELIPMTLEQRVEWLEEKVRDQLERANALAAQLEAFKVETNTMLEAFWRAHRVVASQAASAARSSKKGGR